ncbi:MAG: hypothetical protein ACE5IJ_09440 [Thermoplasmata archaeon]
MPAVLKTLPRFKRFLMAFVAAGISLRIAISPMGAAVGDGAAIPMVGWSFL